MSSNSPKQQQLLLPYNPPRYISQNIPAHLIPQYYIPLTQQYQSDWKHDSDAYPQLQPELALRNPTPIHTLTMPHSDTRNRVHLVKRDDLTGLLLSGNKVRKLEFLLGKALAGEAPHQLTQSDSSTHSQAPYDCVITIGGSQSNHCRATAVASQKASLPCHLILREDSEFDSLQGNLLLDSVMGAHIHTVSKERYQKEGQWALLKSLQKQLWEKENKRAFIIPSGGSDATGLFGYVECFEEIRRQFGEKRLKDQLEYIVVPTGSGGTVTGLAIAAALAGYSNIKVIGMAVCDDDSFFYDYCDEMLKELQLDSRFKARDIMEICDTYKGRAYAESTTEELQLLVSMARENQIMFDPVYSGKAVNGLLQEERFKKNPEKVLFIHTGGLFGLWSKTKQMQDAGLFTKREPLE